MAIIDRDKLIPIRNAYFEETIVSNVQVRVGHGKSHNENTKPVRKELSPELKALAEKIRQQNSEDIVETPPDEPQHVEVIIPIDKNESSSTPSSTGMAVAVDFFTITVPTGEKIKTINNGWDYTTQDIIDGTAPIPYTELELLSIIYTDRVIPGFDPFDLPDDSRPLEKYVRNGVPRFHAHGEDGKLPDLPVQTQVKMDSPKREVLTEQQSYEQMMAFFDKTPMHIRNYECYWRLLAAIEIGHETQSPIYKFWLKEIQQGFLYDLIPEKGFTLDDFAVSYHCVGTFIGKHFKMNQILNDPFGKLACWMKTIPERGLDNPCCDPLTGEKIK